MKTIILLLVCVVMLFACNKEDDNMVINKDLVKEQVFAAKPVTKEEVWEKFPSQTQAKEKTNLKAAQMNGNDGLVEVYELDENTFSMCGSYADRYFLYVDITAEAYRQKYLTIIQQFYVDEYGVVDTKNYTLKVKVGCPAASQFRLSSIEGLQQLTFFFHFDDGRELSYFANDLSGYPELAPLPNGYWEAYAFYVNDGVYQEFKSLPIDYYGSDEIELDIQLDQPNAVSSIEIPKKYLEGVVNIELVGEDLNTGDFAYRVFPVSYRQDMAKYTLYNAPFEIKRIYIYYADRECTIIDLEYDTDIEYTITNKNGVKNIRILQL